MSYQYDSKINRELAKTALDIHMRELNESTQESVPSGQEELITKIIFEFVTNSCVLAEQSIGRKMTDMEITAYAQELLENIESMDSNDQYRLVTELMNVNNG